ncbi:MAG TPA: hypothetical protein VGP41_14275 [Candidatus Lustribacter sp.]|jgi:hypothetical protein|nr:hypothetical protein [Candidatus Lustribacter sp.]
MNRLALASGSIACFASAILLWPSGVRSQLDVQPLERPVATTPRPEQPLVAIAPQGDAFAPRAVVDDDPPPVRPAAPPLPQLHTVRPNLLHERTVALTRVTAIATGANPTAVVETGGATRIVNVGDSLDGSTVAAIDDDAIRLADGRRLSLEPPDATR